MELQYVHLQLVLLLVEGDQLIPDLFGRTRLHLLYAVALPRGRLLLLVLYYVSVQFLVEGLLRPVLPLGGLRRLFIFLLPALGGG